MMTTPDDHTHLSVVMVIRVKMVVELGVCPVLLITWLAVVCPPEVSSGIRYALLLLHMCLVLLYEVRGHLLLYLQLLALLCGILCLLQLWRCGVWSESGHILVPTSICQRPSPMLSSFSSKGTGSLRPVHKKINSNHTYTNHISPITLTPIAHPLTLTILSQPGSIPSHLCDQSESDVVLERCRTEGTRRGRHPAQWSGDQERSQWGCGDTM